MEDDILQQIIYSIQSGLREVKEESHEFRLEAERQNFSMSKFMSDLSSKFFVTQNKQQADLNDSMDEVERQSAATNQNINELQSITQESVSLLSQISIQMKDVAQGIGSLVQLFQQNSGQGQFSFGGMVGGGLSLLGGAAATAAIGAGLSSLTDVGSASAGQILPGGGNSDTGGSGNALSVAEMTRLAKQAGFSDQEAAIMGAIGAAESSGNPRAHNPNASTGDNSYGLWQINMLGNMGPERRRQFGIENNEQLWDPSVNAKAAKTIFDQQGFNAWSVYKSGAYRQYLGTAQESLQSGGGENTGTPEKDDSFAPQGTIIKKDNIGKNNYSGGGGTVLEKQSELAGIRKLPLNPKLKGVLEQAAAATGVEVVVFSGGQAKKGSNGPRTGSTRHDEGNAADVYLMKDGKKLVDTNPEDREIMAKFVSSAVSAGATGVGAGHSYMGPSNIHIGFGNQATWGGAPWIKNAASGVYSNENLASESGMGGEGNQGGQGSQGGETNPFSGTPFAGLTSQISGALATLTGFGQSGAGMLGGGMPMMGGAGMLASAMPMIGSMIEGLSSVFSNSNSKPTDYKSDAQAVAQNDKPSQVSEMSNNLSVERTVAEITKQETKPQVAADTSIQSRPTEGVRGPAFTPTSSASIDWVDRLGGRNKFPKSFNINGVYS